MGMKLVTPPVIEPISLDEALAQCRIESDTEDGLVSGYILAARVFAEANTRRALIKQSYSYSIDFEWPVVRVRSSQLTMYRTRIEIPKTPVISIDSVSYVDSDGNEQTLAADVDYVAMLDEVVPYIEPAYNVAWAAPRYQPACATIDFTAGYGVNMADIPETLRQAMLMLVAYWYKNRGDDDPIRGVVPLDVPDNISGLMAINRQARVLS